MKVNAQEDIEYPDRQALEALQLLWFKKVIRTSITIKPVVEFHESGKLSVQEGKAIRVVDERGNLY